jgi:hypothetical protein
MKERLQAFKFLLGIGFAFAAGYLVGAKMKEKEYEEELGEQWHEAGPAMNEIRKTSAEVAEEKAKLEEERKAFEEEKEHFNEVKHQLYSDLTKEEQLMQLCDPELEIPVVEDNILRYNRIKRQYLRIDFIDEKMYGYGQSSEFEAFDTVECHMFKDGTIYDEDGNRIDDDDTHLGNLCSGMGTGKGSDIRYIRNWEEGVDYCVTYDTEYETGEDWLNEWLGEDWNCGDAEEALDQLEKEIEEDEDAEG